MKRFSSRRTGCSSPVAPRGDWNRRRDSLYIDKAAANRTLSIIAAAARLALVDHIPHES
ncbi:hypothetical protein BCEP4_390117 [Burkholderia cepacia]|nr:hypothetical protein BCEP4_390117 [Burkholderia cepacia]